MAVDPAERRQGILHAARRWPAAATLRRALSSPHAPLAFVVLASLAVAALAATVASKIGAIALDEMILKQSAVHYTSGLPGTLFHDVNARATSRLYSLVLAPLFAAYDGDQAVRAARVFNTLLFASASIPAYLLALRVAANRWLAAVAAVLGMAAPWLILTTVIYTENLAFPLFLWAVWAMERAVREPRADRDLVALALVAALMTTRTQFGVVFVAYWICAALVPILRARDRGPLPDALPLLRQRWLRRHPFSVAVLSLVAAYALYIASSGRMHTEIQKVFGGYSEIQDRTHVSSDVSLGLLLEVVGLSLGIGILPAVAGIAWYSRALRTRARPEWTFALVAIVTVVVFAVATIYAQGGYIGERTEERYYFYAIPLLWIGAVAALRGPLVPTRRALAVAAGALALLYSVMPFPVVLTPQTGFLTPALASANRLLPDAINKLGLAGLTVHDLLLVVTVLAATLLLATWSRRRWTRAVVIVALPAVVQLGLTAYVFAVARGDVHGVPARTAGEFAKSGWVDRALASSAEATWLNNRPVSGAASSDDEQRATLFWNDRITSTTQVPELGVAPVQWPLAGLSLANVRLDPSSGLVGSGQVTGAVVQAASAPQLQLAGTRLAGSPDRALELVRTDVPSRARWAAVGIDANGWIGPKHPARLLATAPRPGQGVKVALTLVAPDAANVKATVRLGDARRRVRLVAGHATVVTLVACPAGSGATLSGSLSGDRAVSQPNVGEVALRLTQAVVERSTQSCGKRG